MSLMSVDKITKLLNRTYKFNKTKKTNEQNFKPQGTHKIRKCQNFIYYFGKNSFIQ